MITLPLAKGYSTSDWVFIGDDAGTNALIRNASYVSLSLDGELLNANANWWTKLIGAQKIATVVAEATAEYGNQPGKYEDKRSSPPRQVTKYNTPIDLAWKVVLASDLPATFKSLKVSIKIATSSKDGLQQVLETAGDLSKTIPNPTPTQNVLGAVSSVKSLLDFLFNKQLLVEQLASDGVLVVGEESTVKPGYYAVFAGDDVNQYRRYQQDSKKLKWSQGALSFNGTNITDVSYFVLKVDFKNQQFPKKDINVLSNFRTAWATLYLEAWNMVEDLNKTNAEAISGKISQTLVNAKKVLTTDPDYVMQEKSDMHDALRNLVIAAFKKRAEELKGDGPFKINIEKNVNAMLHETK